MLLVSVVAENWEHDTPPEAAGILRVFITFLLPSRLLLSQFKADLNYFSVDFPWLPVILKIMNIFI